MTNTMKMNKLTKSEYHTDVVPAFVAYRKEMHKACKIRSRGTAIGDYCRIFTEPRVNGARSKYWFTRSSMPTPRIEEYIMNNPTFTTAAGRVMKVSARWVDTYLSYRRNNGDFALFCKLVK